jgi:uncharacterized protein YjbI with pentapeptide repeats
MSKSVAGPQASRWVGLAAITVAAVAVIIVLFGPVTDLIARHDVGAIIGAKRAAALPTARDAVRGRLLQLAAGLFVAGALVYTARNFILSREGQVTDRYTKAIEQLGSDKLDVRIGGIYALERIARDSARDHPTVMEVLAAFIREHSHEQWPLPATDDPGDAPRRATRPDVQAAVTVIVRRDRRRDRDLINLARADLTGAELGNADLGGIRLGEANLSHAQFNAANLTGAMLPIANLTGAYFISANLTGALLHSANLTRAILIDANLTNAELSYANLTQAQLAGVHPLHAHLGGTRLIGADLTDASFQASAVRPDTDLTDALISQNAAVPSGWVRDADSGRLKRASNKPSDAP